MDVNKIVLIGHVVRDIGERDYGYTTSGKARLNLSIAVNEGYGDKKTVSYFDVTYWGKPAESIKSYINKGKQIAVEGRLKQDRWEKDGCTNSRVYVIADNIQLLGGKSEGGKDQAERDGGYYQSAPAQTAPAQDDGGDFPEDIPF